MKAAAAYDTCAAGSFRKPYELTPLLGAKELRHDGSYGILFAGRETLMMGCPY